MRKCDAGARLKGSRGRRMLRPKEVEAMLRLHELGWGTRRIAREFGCGRNTVRRYLESDGALAGEGRRAESHQSGPFGEGMTNGGPQRSETGTSGCKAKITNALIEVRPSTRRCSVPC